ncbi:MAG: methylated-DNA--[protein]-cysteine S-methyltransferase [Pseudolabrys sp.]
MTTRNFSIFDTALGACGIVWTERGVAGVQVHDGSEHATRARMLRRFPGAQEAPPPVDVQHAIDGIVALLRGEQRDLNDVSIDAEDLPAFNRKVYDITRAIPPGATLTYGEIAERLGDKLLARDVGQALGQNPIPLIVPCHRVLAASGKTGGFSAPGGVASKLRLLTIEGAQPNGPTLFDHLPLVAKRRRRS